MVKVEITGITVILIFVQKPRYWEFKKCFLCHPCGQLGHWAADHSPDETIKNELPSSYHLIFDKQIFDTSRKNFSVDQNGNRKKPALGFTSLLIAAEGKTLCCNIFSKADSSSNAGPLVDYGAAFSAIFETELRLMSSLISISTVMESIPDELPEYGYYQYGTRSHTCSKRKILCPVVF